MGENNRELGDMVGQQGKERTTPKRKQGESGGQKDVGGKTGREDPVGVVLEKAVVSASFSNVAHDFAVHACVEDEGIDPAGLDKGLPRDEVLEGEEGGLRVLDQLEISEEVFHVGVGLLVLQLSGQVLLAVAFPVAFDCRARGHLRQVAGPFPFHPHLPCYAPSIYVHDRLPVLDVLRVQDQQISRGLFPLLQVQDISLPNVTPAEAG